MNIGKIISLTTLILFTIINTSNAQYYWVGGTGDWSDFANHWATTSGGGMFHTEAPTQDDDVFFNANSFSESGQTVTLDLTQNICNSMDWTGVQFFPAVECDFYDDLWIYGSVTFAADVTYNLSEVRLASADAGNTITSNGSYLGSSSSIRKYGTGECSLTDNLNCEDFFLVEGTFSTNNKDMNIESTLKLDGLLNRTMNMGSSNIYCNQWRTTGNNVIINPGTSTIHTRSMYADDGVSGPYTYNNLVFTGQGLLYGSGIFNEIDATGTAGDVLRMKGGNTIVCNQFILNATSNNPTEMFMQIGTGFVTIVQSSGTVDISYVIMSDIHATGGATFNVNPGVDNGNNDGWNFTAIVPQNFFWVGNGGDWEDVSHWATTSGGEINHDAPPSQFDDVFFDANSITMASQSVNINEPSSFRNMDWTGVQNNPYFYAGYQDDLDAYGDITFPDNLNMDLYSVTLQGEEGDIYFGSTGFVHYLTFWGGGIYNLLSEVNCNSFALYNGTVNTNGNTIDCSLDFKEGNYNDNIYNLGASEIFCRDLSVVSDNATINAGTSIIHVDRDFKGKDEQYYHVIMENEGSIFQNNTFQTLEFAPGALSQIEASSTQTVLGDIIIEGTSLLPINISSTEDGVQGTFNKSTGTVDATYVSLKDNNATGGATFNATQSIDNGNNTGWNIAELAPQDFYWVGGTGNWTDMANHWATSSGGNIFYNSAPGPLDNVYFDENSFDAAAQVVTIDVETINFFDMDWTGVTNNPDFSGSQETMNIYGSMRWSENMTANVKYFNFFGEGNHAINTGSADAPGTNAYFYFNSGGTWDMMNSFTVRELSLEGGTVNINENTAHIDFATYFFGTNNKVLNIGSQEYYTRTMIWQDSGENLQINASASNIVCSGSFSPVSAINNNIELNLNNLHFTNDNGMDTGSITTELNLNTLSIDPGKELTIQASMEITVVQLLAQGTEDDFIILRGLNDGIQATINQISGTVDGQYLDLKDISGSGGAEFYANNSINSGNVSGWIFTGIAQTIDFPVIDDVMEDVGTVNLDATASSGLDVSYSIVSGPATLDGNVLTITGPGSVQVQASQAGDVEFNPAPSATNTFCSIPLQPSITGVIDETAILTSSSVFGNQWFFNGSEIDSATDQEYEGTSNGTYTVQIDVDGCVSAMSDDYDVTSLSISELTNYQSLEVYPNPSDGVINLDINLTDNATYTIYSTEGKLIVHAIFDNTNKTINMNTMESGMYILLLDDSNIYYQTRIIKK